MNACALAPLDRRRGLPSRTISPWFECWSIHRVDCPPNLAQQSEAVFQEQTREFACARRTSASPVRSVVRPLSGQHRTSRIVRSTVRRRADARPLPPRQYQYRGNCLEQALIAQRLGDMGVHPDIEAQLAVTSQRMGGHGNDREMLTRLPLLFANSRGLIEPAHDRHRHIHEHYIENVLAPPVENFGTVIGHLHRVCCLFQGAHSQQLIDRVVLSDQYSQSTDFRRSGDRSGGDRGGPILCPVRW